MCCKNKQNNGDLRRSSTEWNYIRPVNLCLTRKEVRYLNSYVYGGSRNSKQRKRTNLLALWRFSAGFLYTTVYRIPRRFFPPRVFDWVSPTVRAQPFLSSDGNFIKLTVFSAFLQTVTTSAILDIAKSRRDFLMNHTYSIAALYYNFNRNAFALIISRHKVAREISYTCTRNIKHKILLYKL